MKPKVFFAMIIGPADKLVDHAERESSCFQARPQSC